MWGGCFKRSVKEGSGNRHLHWIPAGGLEVGLLTGDSEKQVKWGSGNGASLSLSVGALRGEPGGRAP